MTNTGATADTKTATVAERGADVAPNGRAKKAAPKKVAKPAVSQRAAKKPVQSARKNAAPPATVARDGSKKAIILELLRRPKGATVTEISKATQWENHSIRGFISGCLRKTMGLIVESTKNDSGARIYRTGK